MVPSRSGRFRAALFVTVIVAGCSGAAIPPGLPTLAPDLPTGDPGVPVNPVPTAAQPAGGSAIEVGRPYQHQVPANTTAPTIYTFQAPPGSVVHVEASAASGNGGPVELTMRPPNAFTMGASIPPGATDSTRAWITSDTSAGTWIVEIDGVDGDQATFTVVAEMQSDGGVTGDAGAHAGTAAAVEPGAELSGLLGDEDQEDWFEVPLKGGEVVTLSIAAPPDQTGSHSATIVHNGERLTSTNVEPGGAMTVRQVFAQEQSGVAQVSVTGRGAYEFSIDVAPQQDGGTFGDAGEGPGSAKRVELGLIEGVLGGEDEVDYYILALPVDAFIRAETTVSPDYLDRARVELLYEGTNIVREDVMPGATRNYISALVNPEGAELHIRVTNGSGTYSLEVLATTQPDGDGAGDAAGERGGAKQVEATGLFEGVINNQANFDAVDWYRFAATQTGTLVMELALDPESVRIVRMQVYEGNRRVGDVTVSSGSSGSVELDVTAGTVYEFQLNTSGIGLYTINFR